MPLSFTIEIPTSEKKSFINEWCDRTREPSSRAKMIARDALAKARVEQAIDDILDAEFMGTASDMISSDPIYVPSEVRPFSSSQSMLLQMPAPPLSNPYVCNGTVYISGPVSSSGEQYTPRLKRKKLESFLNQHEEEMQSYHKPDVLLMRDDGIQVLRSDDRYEYDCCNAVMAHTSPESVIDFEVVDESFADNEQQKQDGRFDTSCSTSNTLVEQSCTKLHRNDWGEEQVPQGFTFHKNFPNFGWIQGTVIQILKYAKDNKTRRVSYRDGNIEDLSIGEIQSAFIEYMEFCSGSAVSGDNTYNQKTLKPSSSTYTACTKSKMQEVQQRLTSSTTSSKSTEKRNKAASIPSEMNEKLFNERLDMLREFKKIHGHVNVPYTFKNSPLFSWSGKVRKAYRQWKAGEKPCYFMNDERVKQLEEIGFIWEVKSPIMQKRFEKRLNELREFRKEYGHVDLTLKSHPEHKALAIWCKNIKAAYKTRLKGDRHSHAISEEKIKRLEELGFNWNLKKRKSQAK